MAYATQDQVLNYLQGGAGQQQTQQGSGSDPTSSVALGGSGGGSGSGLVSSQPGVGGQSGVGGQKLWTNIQSYLTANQDQKQPRADNVKNAGQSVLNTEQNALDKSANDTKSSADKAAEPVTSIGTDKASQLIQQGTSAQKGSDQYKQAYDPLKTAISAQYTGPTQYSYGLSADAQNIGNATKDSGAFNGFLSQFDKNLQGGRDLTTGQRGLQNQLDSQNEYLEQARGDLNNAYTGLSSQVGDKASEVGKYLQDLQGKFQTGQNDLKSYLGTTGSQDQSAIQKAIADHNNELGRTQTQYDQWAAAHPYTDPADQKNQYVMDAYNSFLGGNSGWQDDFTKQSAAKKAIDANNYWYPENKISQINEKSDFTPGEVANASNVGGVDDQRNQWNFIADLLGQQGVDKADRYASDAVFKPGFSSNVVDSTSDTINSIRNRPEGSLWL